MKLPGFAATALERAAAFLGFERRAAGGGAPASPGEHGRIEGKDRSLYYPSPVLTPNMLTLAAARAILAEHESGRFVLSAAFARAALRDPDLKGALDQRLLALVGAPHCIEAAAATGPGERYARDLSERFRAMVPRAAELDVVRDGIMLGVGCGQIVWWWRDDFEEAIPVLEPWPAECLEHDPTSGTWYVITRKGREAITPGDGRWLLYAPWSTREPYVYGAVRQIAEWVIRASNAARDYGRFIELSGNGILKAMVPSGGRGTPEHDEFIAGLRMMGRSPVVPLPQGREKHESYDLVLEALSSDMHKVFVEMLRIAAGKLRLAILGQDLTSQNNKVGTNASSETGMRVNGNVSRADSETWMDCLRGQFLLPWALYRGRPELTPWAYYDLEEERDAKGEAEAAKTAAEALAGWRDLFEKAASEREVDLTLAAERWGIPTRQKPKPEAEGRARGARRLVLVARGYRGGGARLAA